MPRIALVEVNEEDIQNMGVPFVLYGIYKENASKKLKAAYLKMAAIRKEMGEQYKVIEALEESNNE